MSPTGARPWLRLLTMRLHRWVALALGAWFALLGLSGALLVWHAEIDQALNPEWFAPRVECGPVATPVKTSLEIFARATRGSTAAQVMAPTTRGAAFVVSEKAAPGGTRRQHFIDAGCGKYLGMRAWGTVHVDRAHLVPTLYELHRSLLSGEVGHVMVGLAGLSLLFVAVTGAITAWPRRSTRDAWKRVLTVKSGASPRRRYYDLHRAGGLWLVAFLLLMSITGAYLCFPKQGRALVASVLPATPVTPRASAAPVPGPRGGLDALVKTAESLWPAAKWTRIQIPADAAAPYEVRLLQQGEIRADTGDTRVRIDASNQVIDVRDPLKAPSGDTLLSWMFPLHSAEALGIIGRAAWTLFGLMPFLLFVTGVWLWWKRQGAMSRR